MGRRGRGRGARARGGGGESIDQLLERLDDGLAEGDRAGIEGVLQGILAEPEATAEALTARFIAGRVRVGGFAFELLAGLAGPEAPELFARIAGATEADDLVRFGAQRRLGWPERGENRQRLAFLASLRDGDGTVATAAAQAAATWPQNSETAEEVLAHLLAMPGKRRQVLVERIIAEAAGAETPPPWLFHALLHAPDKGTQRLARTTGDARLRAEAEAAAAEIAAIATEPLELPPLGQALLSMIDGDGGQVALVIRDLSEGICTVANIFHNEASGIKGTFGSTWIPQDDAEAMIEQLEDSGVAMVGVPLAAVRGALAGALARNAELGQGLPPGYELWEPFLHDAYPPAADEETIAPILDDAPFAGRADLVARGDALLAHPFFQHWGFDADAVRAALAAVPAAAGFSPLAAPELPEAELVPLVRALATPAARARLRDRLRRQAWLLDHLEDGATRDLALANAAALATDDPAALAGLPLLRELAVTSVQHALLWGFYG